MCGGATAVFDPATQAPQARSLWTKLNPALSSFHVIAITTLLLTTGGSTELFLDPLNCISFQPVLHGWCNKGRGMYHPICGLVHTEDILLRIKNGRKMISSLIIRRHINVDKMCWVRP